LNILLYSFLQANKSYVPEDGDLIAAQQDATEAEKDLLQMRITLGRTPEGHLKQRRAMAVKKKLDLATNIRAAADDLGERMAGMGTHVELTNSRGGMCSIDEDGRIVQDEAARDLKENLEAENAEMASELQGIESLKQGPIRRIKMKEFVKRHAAFEKAASQRKQDVESSRDKKAAERRQLLEERLDAMGEEATLSTTRQKKQDFEDDSDRDETESLRSCSTADLRSAMAPRAANRDVESLLIDMGR